MQTCFINPRRAYCPWHVTVSVGMLGCYSFNKSTFSLHSNLTCHNPGKHPHSPLIYWIQQNQSSMWIRGKVQHLWQLYIVLMDTTQKGTSSLQKYFQAYESTWSSRVLAQNSHYCVSCLFVLLKMSDSISFCVFPLLLHCIALPQFASVTPAHKPVFVSYRW